MLLEPLDGLAQPLFQGYCSTKIENAGRPGDIRQSPAGILEVCTIGTFVGDGRNAGSGFRKILDV